MIPYKAYTERYNQIENVLITKCHVGVPALRMNPLSDFTEFRGLWDTGAMCSVISSRAAMLLNLVPVSKMSINHADGQSVVNVFTISVVLPNNVLFPFIEVAEGKFTNFDLLIGMDLISKGDFSISNFDGKTTFSFRTPSFEETDFENNTIIK